MREIVLHDTRSGELRRLEPRDAGRVGVYACGPTVYSRIHIGNARPYVIFMLFARFLRSEGLDVSLVINLTDVNDKIYDAARGAGSAVAGARRADVRSLHRRHRRARARAPGPRAARVARRCGPIVDYIQTLIDRGHAYAGAGRRLLPRCARTPATASLSHRSVESMDQGEGLEGSRPQGGSARLRAVEGAQGGRGHLLAVAMGRGAAGLAHRVLGDGGGAPRASASTIHGGGSDLVFPHHENEAAQTRAARGHELAEIWMHNGMIQFTGEKMSKSVGNIAALHEVHRRRGPAGRGDVPHLRALPPAARPSPTPCLEQAQANVARIREAGRRLTPGALARGARRPAGGASSTRSPATSTPRRRWRS